MSLWCGSFSCRVAAPVGVHDYSKPPGHGCASIRRLSKISRRLVRRVRHSDGSGAGDGARVGKDSVSRPGQGPRVRTPEHGALAGLEQGRDCPLPGCHPRSAPRGRHTPATRRPPGWRVRWRGRPGKTGSACSPPPVAEGRAIEPAQGFRAAQQSLVVRQLRGSGFGVVAAKPGQRHLVAIDGLRFGPDDGRQCVPHGGAGRRGPGISRGFRGHGGVRPDPAAADGHVPDAAARSRRQRAAQFRWPPRGQTPGAVERCRRRRAAAPCRRRRRQRRQGVGGRCSREPVPVRPPSPARRPVPQKVRPTRQPVPRTTRQRTARGLPVGFVPVPAAPAPGLSARSQSARRRNPPHLPDGPPDGLCRGCQDGWQHPLAARFRPARQHRACSEKGGAAGFGG